MEKKIRFLEKLILRQTETRYHHSVVSFVFEESSVLDLYPRPRVELYYFYNHIDGMPYRVVREVEKALQARADEMVTKYLNLDCDLHTIVLRNPF
jgi:hypothetical protein